MNIGIGAAKLWYYRNMVVPLKVRAGNIRSERLYRSVLAAKECYYGPFTGELGHLLGHNLPFIAHLHAVGVKVHFCGMEIHRPFFKDENNADLVASFLPVRDFFNEAVPDCNTAKGPEDVGSITNLFIEQANASCLPYWDNSDSFYYFESFRWWVLKKGFNSAMDLSRIYKTRSENSVVIFPRKHNAVYSREQLKNNGEVWDYTEIARLASRHFEKVYIVGHPAFSLQLEAFDNVEVIITNDNRFILEKCSNSRLIITPHSGAVYYGEYTDTPVLIIYKGGTAIGDIETTRRFKAGLGNRHEFSYAFSLNEIENFIRQL